MFLRFGNIVCILYLGTGSMATVGLYEYPLLVFAKWKRWFGLF
jgi:hypothetical protein